MHFRALVGQNRSFKIIFGFFDFFFLEWISTLRTMSTEADMLRLSARPRNTRSHSLKPQSQPMMQFKQRSKRTMSLPSKPVLLPLINIQRCQDNWKDESDEDESVRIREEMGMLQL